MAKKRKIDQSTSIEPPKKPQQQQQAKPQPQPPQPQQNLVEDDGEEYEYEYEEVEEEVEEYEEIEEEEEEQQQQYQNDNNYEDDDPIHSLLEPFGKDQLLSLLADAATKHRDVADRIRKIADENPVHRKIFVHGLGWDTTAENLQQAFTEFGEIEDCKAVTDKISGKSKGYGFILFKTRLAARKALIQPQKKIGNRMTACQLASTGPVPSPATPSPAWPGPVSEYTRRKIYVSNVGPEIDPQKLYAFFAKFGEIEEGPLGLDRATGKPKGFCLFVYKTLEGARKALEEQHKNFDGHILHCQQAVDGPKAGKNHHNQNPNNHFHHRPKGNGRGENYSKPVHSANTPPPAIGYDPAAAATAATINPALGQALTALLASQGGLGNLLGGLGMAASGYGNHQGGVGPSGVGGVYGSQGSGYSGQPGGAGRGQGGVGQYGGGAGYTGQ